MSRAAATSSLSDGGMVKGDVMNAIDELLRTVSTVTGYVMAVGIVGLFATMAVMLWSWRKASLEDDDGR